MIINEADRKYIILNTHNGLFNYIRNPFGIEIAQLENSLLSGVTLKGVCVFQKDAG